MVATHSTPRLILASKSPRRASLLQGITTRFEVISMEVDEAHDASLTPAELTLANARTKAAVVSSAHPGAITLGADTLVYVDGQPLGKPADLEEAAQMLERLSGRRHEVCTGVALMRDGKAMREMAVITEVWFLPLTAETITRYHERVDPLDKAGGYGIQAASELILDRIEGSWSNVVGLPIERLRQELTALNLADR
jgi:septum formation protein